MNEESERTSGETSEAHFLRRLVAAAVRHGAKMRTSSPRLDAVHDAFCRAMRRRDARALPANGSEASWGARVASRARWAERRRQEREVLAGREHLRRMSGRAAHAADDPAQGLLGSEIAFRVASALFALSRADAELFLKLYVARRTLALVAKETYGVDDRRARDAVTHRATAARRKFYLEVRRVFAPDEHDVLIVDAALLSDLLDATAAAFGVK